MEFTARLERPECLNILGLLCHPVGQLALIIPGMAGLLLQSQQAQSACSHVMKVCAAVVAPCSLPLKLALQEHKSQLVKWFPLLFAPASGIACPCIITPIVRQTRQL